MTPQAARTIRSADRVRVYQVAAERLLAGLPDRSIDLLITDPPYVSVNRSGTHLRDWFADGLTWPQIGHVFAIARRKLKPDGVLMAMTNNDGMREAIGALERAGFSRVRVITWDRQYPGLGSGLRHQCEFCLVGRLPGSRTLAGVDLVSVAAVGPGTADRYPTAKPDGLGRKLAAMAGIGRGDLVVDPFCGSGALLVGALERGASVIAGDVARRAVRLAGARLAQAAPAHSLPTPPKSAGRQATGLAPARPGRQGGPARGRPKSRQAISQRVTRPAPVRPGRQGGKAR
jgi:DNA modification methylase